MVCAVCGTERTSDAAACDVCGAPPEAPTLAATFSPEPIPRRAQTPGSGIDHGAFTPGTLLGTRYRIVGLLVPVLPTPGPHGSDRRRTDLACRYGSKPRRSPGGPCTSESSRRGLVQPNPLPYRSKPCCSVCWSYSCSPSGLSWRGETFGAASPISAVPFGLQPRSAPVVPRPARAAAAGDRVSDTSRVAVDAIRAARGRHLTLHRLHVDTRHRVTRPVAVFWPNHGRRRVAARRAGHHRFLCVSCWSFARWGTLDLPDTSGARHT